MFPSGPIMSHCSNLSEPRSSSLRVQTNGYNWKIPSHSSNGGGHTGSSDCLEATSQVDSWFWLYMVVATKMAISWHFNVFQRRNVIVKQGIWGFSPRFRDAPIVAVSQFWPNRPKRWTQGVKLFGMSPSFWYPHFGFKSKTNYLLFQFFSDCIHLGWLNQSKSLNFLRTSLTPYVFLRMPTLVASSVHFSTNS